MKTKKIPEILSVESLNTIQAVGVKRGRPVTKKPRSCNWIHMVSMIAQVIIAVATTFTAVSIYVVQFYDDSTNVGSTTA